MNGDGVLEWRPIERGDAGRWAGLTASIQMADQNWEYLSEQDLLEEFDDPFRDYTRGSAAIFDGGTMIGYGILTSRSAADPVHDMRYEGGVHPDYRGQGLGGRLLDWAQQAAVPLHEERYRGRPLRLSGSCLTRNAAAVALYAAHGYRQVRWFHAMSRDLEATLPDVPAPAGVQITGFTPERAQDALLVRNEAFRDHWNMIQMTGDGWARFLAYAAFRPTVSFLAYAGDEPLGIIIGHEYDAYQEATGIRDLYIALIGTRRAGRKRGIASALLARTLAMARAEGCTAASLDVDADSPTGALSLYERAGFSVRHTSVRQTKTLLPAPLPVP